MKKSFLKLLKISAIYVAFACFIFINKSFAVTTTAGSDLIVDFGSFAQLQENASIVLPYSGSTTQTGISNYVGSPDPASVIYTQTNLGFGQFEEVTITTSSISATSAGDGCTITLSNFTASESNFTVYRENNLIGSATSKTVTYGATLTIKGFCTSGTYGGTITIPYTSEACDIGSWFGGSCTDNTGDPMVFNWTVTIWDKIGATETQSLDFGSMMSPQTDTTVTITPSGGRSKGGDIWLDESNAGRAGSFDVISSGNRTFYVEFPNSATLSGSGGTMVVDTFTVNDGNLSTSSDGTAVFNVGATLHVPANISAGTYSGTYDVRVYY